MKEVPVDVLHQRRKSTVHDASYSPKLARIILAILGVGAIALLACLLI